MPFGEYFLTDNVYHTQNTPRNHCLLRFAPAAARDHMAARPDNFLTLTGGNAISFPRKIPEQPLYHSATIHRVRKPPRAICGPIEPRSGTLYGDFARAAVGTFHAGTRALMIWAASKGL